MSDVVARMKLESQDFDNKLKSATANLQHMEREVRRTGATFEYADKEEVEFLRSLGSMQTKAMDAKGQIKELSNSYKELAMMYRRMSDEEKQGTGGKALASSLQQLKTRLEDTKQSFASVSAEIGEGGGLSDALKQLGGKIGINLDLFTRFGPVIAGVGAAIKVGTDAFKQNDEMLDDWNATVAGAQSIYESFLVSLNTGDFSGFLRRMSNVSRAAREAYDALDKLGTFNAFNQINLQRAQTQFTEAVASYREGTGSKSEVRAAADAWKNELETRRKMEQEAYLAKIRDIAASRGVDADLLTKALSGNYGDYETLKATQMPTKSVYNTASRSFNDVIDNDAATEVQKLGQALRQLNDTQLQEIQALGRQAQATATEIAQVDRQTVRMLGKSGVGGGASAAVTPTAATDAATMTYAEDSIKAQEAKVTELTKLWKEASAELRNGYYAQLQKAKSELEEMTKGPLTELKGQMSFAVEPVKIKIDSSNLKLAKNDAKGMRDAFSAAASAVATVGGALQQIEDPAAKVAGIIAAAIAQVALTFASSLKGTIGPWDWIAAATAGLATMISTITAIKSVTSAGNFAQGGVVGGNSYSGDNMIAHVNSGETILSVAQSNNVAAALQSNPMGNLRLSTEISGTNLRIVMNNDNRARGGQRGFYSEIH